MRLWLVSEASMVKFERKLCYYQCLVIYLFPLFAWILHILVDDTLIKNMLFFKENHSGIMMLNQ